MSTGINLLAPHQICRFDQRRFLYVENQCNSTRVFLHCSQAVITLSQKALPGHSIQPTTYFMYVYIYLYILPIIYCL